MHYCPSDAVGSIQVSKRESKSGSRLTMIVAIARSAELAQGSEVGALPIGGKWKENVTMSHMTGRFGIN